MTVPTLILTSQKVHFLKNSHLLKRRTNFFCRMKMGVGPIIFSSRFRKKFSKRNRKLPLFPSNLWPHFLYKLQTFPKKIRIRMKLTGKTTLMSSLTKWVLNSQQKLSLLMKRLEWIKWLNKKSKNCLPFVKKLYWKTPLKIVQCGMNAFCKKKLQVL